MPEGGLVNIARIIAAHLEANGDRYDLANSASIKVLAIDLQDVLLAGGIVEDA